ncbi:MAG: cytochrome c peroxidase [Chitinophagaceae bacterium]
MKILLVILSLIIAATCFSFMTRSPDGYRRLYDSRLAGFKSAQQQLLQQIRQADLSKPEQRDAIRSTIHQNRQSLKTLDFWLRYFEPVAYRKLNGPLPVEWETEVFEKFEPPYKRKGSGLTLAELYLDEPIVRNDSLQALIHESIDSLATFEADSITSQLSSFEHFFLANRMFLLNLSGIYTTGFECPDTSRVIPELRSMLHAVKSIYTQYNENFTQYPISPEYLQQYDKLLTFADQQPAAYSAFNHFSFIRDYVNPLFRITQAQIRDHNIYSTNYNDYALSNDCNSIFDKSLFISQNTKGIFSLVEDPEILSEIKKAGKLLFYDPILSGNNKRSCASCHKPTEYFTDTTLATPLRFDGNGYLPRNTPSLINAIFNHLSMLDGKHISLQGQARDVIQNPEEMNSTEQEVVKKVMSCAAYKTAFKKFVKYTPEEKNVSLSHIVSAITYYYADFSHYYSPFDDAMNEGSSVDPVAIRGFNLFMSKAQCATCHFVPHFNGVKPPYIGSEFEVLGTPADAQYKKLSEDKGRYGVNPAEETLHAFRTGTVRNAAFTHPYMHNGVFRTLEELVDFYDGGGGAGRGLNVPNQTLSSDSLKLSAQEKKELIVFMQSLTEKINFEIPPSGLPPSDNRALNTRKVGGEY